MLILFALSPLHALALSPSFPFFRINSLSFSSLYFVAVVVIACSRCVWSRLSSFHDKEPEKKNTYDWRQVLFKLFMEKQIIN